MSVTAFYYQGESLKPQRDNQALEYEGRHLSPVREEGILISIISI